MKRLSIFVLLAVGILFGSKSSLAQVATGTPPFGSFGGGPVDVINLANLNAHFSVPVINKAGRGMPFAYNITYDSSVWYPVTSGSTTSWQPILNWGWAGSTQTATGYLGASVTTVVCSWERVGVNEIPNGWHTSATGYVYYDPWGVPHPFPGTSNFYSTTCSGTNNNVTATATDGSGYTLNGATTSTGTLTSRNGKAINPPFAAETGAATVIDRNGNEISVSSSGVFTDTLGTTVLTVAGTAPNPTTFTYTPPSGNNVSYTMKYTDYNILTNLGCSGITEYSASNVPLVSEIDLPDGSKYTFAYEATPGHSGYVTGRLASVTVPTGGTISYTYTGGSNGIECSDGSTAGLDRTTPDGSWTYARSGTAPAWTTTVTDPQSNQTVLNFQGIYETERQVYSSGGTLLKTIIKCYNGNTSNCNSTAVTLPISQKTVYVKWPGGLESETNALYNTYGLATEVDEYAYGNGSPGSLTRKTLTTYASLGNGIYSMPASVTVQDGSGNTKAQTTYTYDQGSVTSTSGTPQHVSVSGSRGNATTVSYLVQGSTTLSKTFTYYDTGTVNTASDVNGAVTTYTYGSGSCGNSFVTSVSEPLSLSRSMAWNCTGGVQTSVTDENGKTTSAAFNDSYFWRMNSTTDAFSNVTNYAYTGATQVESSLVFNGSSSTVDVLKTLDGLGRTHVSQLRESPSSSTYDSSESDFDTLGRPTRGTLPYAGTGGQTNSTAPGSNIYYDALGRKTQITNSGSLNVTFTYSQNDTLQKVGPAPTGENAKQKTSRI